MYEATLSKGVRAGPKPMDAIPRCLAFFARACSNMAGSSVPAENAIQVQ